MDEKGKLFIDLVQKSSPGAVQLARLVSLAARIEPELIRAMRLCHLPEVDAGAEADLWFSPLVAASSPLSITFRPEVLSELRKQLASKENRNLINQAWGTLQLMHRLSQPSIRLEEKVTYLSLSGASKEEIDKALMSVVAALFENDDQEASESIARWTRRMLPRLPENIRDIRAARILDVGAAHKLEKNFLFGIPSLKDLKFVEWLAPDEMKRVPVGVRLISSDGKKKWEFSYPPKYSRNIIEAPKTDPIVIEISLGLEKKLIYLPLNKHAIFEDSDIKEITVRTGIGKSFVLKQGSYYDKCWALVVGINDYMDNRFAPLQNAMNDAESFAKILSDLFNFNIRSILGDMANRNTILEEIKSELPRSIGPNDGLVIFFAGHALTRTTASGQIHNYLIPCDAQINEYHSFIDMEELSKACILIPAKNILIVLDCILSGIVPRFESPSESASSDFKSSKDIDFLSAFANNTSVQILAPRMEDGRDSISPDAWHSPFAKALLDGLRGGAADANDDSIITATNLYKYVAKRLEGGLLPGPTIYVPASSRRDFVFQLLPESRKMDFLLITFLPEERDAVLKKLANYKKLRPSEDDIHTYFQAEVAATFPDGNSGSYKVIVLPLLGMGLVQAATAYQAAIDRWSPQYIMVIGIAGGIAARGVQIGDILIADQIANYELHKVTPEGPEISWDVHQVDPRLLSACNNYIDDSWKKLLQVVRPGQGEPGRFNGPIASGDKVVAFGDFLKKSIETWPKLIGIEMEPAGVVKAATQSSAGSRFFMVRCASDLADKNKDLADTKKWRDYACDVAASFAIGLIRSGPVPLAKG